MNSWLAIVMVLALLGICFLSLQQFRKRLTLHPEISRKLMHVLMGLLAASFPWFFREPWPVLLLATLSLPLLVFVRTSASGSFRDLLHGVKRISWGELLFPIAVAVLFLLAGDNALLYSLPVLILTLADAVAALIGIFYGRTLYTTLEGYKSLEGSVAFLFVTFLCVHIGLLLFTNISRLDSLLIGLLIGVIVMMVEASAWRGLDNIFIPISSFALLKIYLKMDANDLVTQLLLLISLGLFILFWRKRSTLDDSSLLGSVLVAYTAWTVGGLVWLAVPMLVFVTATWLALRAGTKPGQNEHTVYALLSISSASLAWLFIGEGLKGEDFFYPYAVGFGAHLVMLGVAREHFGKTKIGMLRVLGLAVLPGWLVIMLPYMVVETWSLQLLNGGLISLVMMVVSAALFIRLQTELIDCPVSVIRWTRQGLIAAMVSVAGWLAFQYLTIVTVE